MNPANQADEFEAKIIIYFQQNQNIHENTGYRNSQDRELFYVAQPIKMETSCLQCHGKPEDAPQVITEKYGTIKVFNWRVEDIKGMPHAPYRYVLNRGC